MNRKHSKAVLITAAVLCLGLAGCNTPNSEESGMESSSALPESAATSSAPSSSASAPASVESGESSSAAPEESSEEPRPLYVESPAAGYEPFQEESGGLYQKIQPAEDIPFEKIDFSGFGEGKILFEYFNEKYPGMRGSDEYMMGNIVVYDIDSKQYVTAEDKWESPYTPTGVPIMMKSGYYYSSWTEDNGNRCVSKIDLATGQKTIPLTFEKDYGGGIGSWTLKTDETHFLINLEENMVVYDTEKDAIQELPAGTFQGTPICQPDGKLYELTPALQHKKSDEWNFKSYDPASGEVKDYGKIAGMTYITPGEPFRKYLSEGETLSEYPFGSNEWLCWIVWKDNVPVRVLGLKSSISGQIRKCTDVGMVYFWKDHVLYLVDGKTGETRVLDFGYREKYEDMYISISREGNVILIPQGQGYHVQQKTFYYISRAAIDQCAVPYGEFTESK